MSPKIKRSLIFHGVTILAFAAYGTFFIVFKSVMGETSAIFSFIPALVTAWLYGIQRGIVAAVLADVFTLALLDYIGFKSWDPASLQHRLPGLIAVVIIALIVGYMRELRNRMKKELEQRVKAEAVLKESEARFKAIYEGTTDAIMLLTEKGFFDCNPRTLEMFGFKSVEEFSRVHPADISPPTQPDGTASFPAAMDRIKRAYETGSNRFEWVHQRTNGAVFPAEVLLSAFDLNGKQVLQATVLDITKRKQAEEALAESEKSFRQMFETTSEGVALLNPQTGRFIATNPTMCRLFGYTEEELHALTPEDITPLETRDVMQESMKILYSGGTVPDHEGVSVKKDGSKINVIVSNRPMSWKGALVFHITFKDVTFLKEIQKRLEQKNRDIIDFTNMVTHDLRNPLTGIKGMLQILKEKKDIMADADSKELVELGLESANYMQNLVSDLLDMARLETGKAILEKANVPIGNIIEPVIFRMRTQATEANIQIKMAVPDCNVLADSKELTKVFMNLLGNAITYMGMPESPQITIGTRPGNDMHTFFVSDNGMGIPKESVPFVFDKFKRGSNVHSIKGTGLGLAIVKGIVEEHGGRIWFESEVGKGTTFFFTIPKA